jgi:uncharacterized protein YwqG
MMGFLKRLFGGASPSGGGPTRKAPDKPPLPEETEAEFKTWWLAQHKRAVALTPVASGMAGARGSRLGGPAWLAEGEVWPSDSQGVPLEFLAQLDLADCRSLQDFPRNGLLQFFIGRDDLFGADFDDLLTGNYLVRHVVPDALGSLHQPPPLETVGGVQFSDFSPFQTSGARETGLALAAEPFEDRIDQSVGEAEQRVYDLYQRYDIAELEAWLEQAEQERPIRHHAGGFPAFTQSDFRYNTTYADYDSVLLRVTSDDSIMWGDGGEAVFMIRSTDLANGDFGKVAFSWDCH